MCKPINKTPSLKNKRREQQTPLGSPCPSVIQSFAAHSIVLFSVYLF